MRLLSSLKSKIVRTVPSFLGIINVGEAHLEEGCHVNTPIFQSLSISFMSTAVCICEIGYASP